MRSLWHASLTAACAALAGFFGWQWHRAHDVTEALERDVAALRQQLALRPTTATPKVEATPTSAPAGPPSATTSRASTAAAGTPAKSGGTTADAAKRSGRGSGLRTYFERLRSMTEAQREALLRQTVRGSIQNMPDFAEEMGLTPEEAQEFMTVLLSTQQRAEMTTDPADYEAMRDDPEVRKRVTDRYAANQKNAEAEAAARFGQATVDRYKKYQQSLGARLQVRELQQAMVERDLPMTPAQRRDLTAALARNYQDGQVRLKNAASALQSASPADARAMRRDYAREMQQRFQSEAVSILTAAQLEVLDRHLAAEIEAMELGEILSGADPFAATESR